MFTNKARTVPEYLAGLPDDRRKLVRAVRSLVRKHLPKGYKEEIGWGAITWVVPLSRFADTYNQQPLCYAALAAQKNNYAVYLTGTYQDPREAAWLRAQFAKAGKRLDTGKSCIRFTSLGALPLEVIGQVIAPGTG